MSDKKFLIGLVVVSVLLIGGGLALAVRGGNSAPASQIETKSLARAVLGETSYDWGEIGINNGNAEAFFTIKNEGADPLKLSNIITSCACTTAQLIMGDQQSPAFGMHNKSAYVFEVPPQGEAQLKVIFDPAYHGPNGVGPINREIKITTNDANQPVLKFIATGMVIR
jgi:hypothetical protein